MISKNENGGFFASHWDWFVAGAGLVLFIAAALSFVVVCGTNPEDVAQDEVASLGSARSKGGVDETDMKEHENAMKLLISPSTLVEPAETQGGFMSSERRVFCEQGDASAESKACGLPIVFGLKVCPLCKAKQPEEVKVVLDSDGDGIPDEIEKKWGLNPNDPSDADSDKDGDGFTNLEEFLAKTDATNKLSHPDYLDSVKIQLPLKETLLPFLFKSVSPAPTGNRFYFVDPKARGDYAGSRGKTYSVVTDQEIGKTGFIAKKYEQKFEKRKIKGGSGTTNQDVSIAIVERIQDHKQFTLVINDKKHVPVDIQATLVYERNGTKEFTVVTGDKIDLSGNEYIVTAITREGSKVKVTLSNVQYGKRTLEALEQ